MLKIGFVSVIRPLFKGDAPGAAARSLEQLKRRGETQQFEVVTAQLGATELHPATGQTIPSFAVSNVGAARQAAQQLREQGADFLLIQHTTFSTGDVLVPLLQAARRVGVWALPEAASGLSPPGPLPFNALCGLTMTLSFLGHPAVRKREPVKWFYGEVDSPWFLTRFQTSLEALRGLKALETARILHIGGTAPAFYGLEDAPAFEDVRVDSKDLADLFAVMAQVSDKEASALARDWQTQEASAVSFEQLLKAARVELGLEHLVQAGDYTALALRCWPELPERLGTMACASLARLGDKRLPAACEGDVMGALSMLALQGASGSPAILMDLSDVDLEDDTLQFWHCGNAPRCWAAEGRSCLRPHFNRETLGVVRDMVLAPGAATGFRLLEGGKQAVICSGTFQDNQKPGFDGVRGWVGGLRWQGHELSARSFIATTLDYRLPHHMAFAQGELTEGLTELAAWLGAEVLTARPSTDAL